MLRNIQLCFKLHLVTLILLTEIAKVYSNCTNSPFDIVNICLIERIVYTWCVTKLECKVGTFDATALVLNKIMVHGPCMHVKKVIS